MKLKDKVVLITGSSRGIGREAAIKLAQEGAQIIIHYHVNKEAALQVLNELTGSGHLMLRADLTSESQIKEMFDEIVLQKGKIDILVNNAGVFDLLDIHQASFEEWKEHWQKTLSTNLTGPAYLSFFVADLMRKQAGGRIINVSSRGAFRGEPMAMAYGTSKAGLNAFGQSMAQALAKDHVFVYTIAPGFVETDMSAPALNSPIGGQFLNESPIGRVARPDEVASLIHYCACDAPDFMTGCIIDINGASYLRT
ncbi:SDR family NAD(P)-dependent oxidoreductase [Bacteroidota bacterium]